MLLVLQNMHFALSTIVLSIFFVWFSNQVNITEHELVPRHIPLSSEEKQNLLQRYKVKDGQLPRIQQTDPVARYFGLSKGQVRTENKQQKLNVMS